MTSPGLTEALTSLVLVALAVAVAKWWRIPKLKDMTLGTVRAFVQLIAVGYALHYLFGLQNMWLLGLALLIMTTVGSHAAASQVKSFNGAFGISFVAIAVGSMVTLAIMLALNIITTEARYLIPLSGMLISNAMNATSLTMNRLVSDLRANPAAIESSLALGKPWRVASFRYQREAAVAGMISILNFMKTVGIVALPGAMTGMILAGADPIEAVLLQVIVAYMLLSAVTISSVVAVELAVRRFFTSAHQFRHEV